jgi:hypothetical protein
VRFTFDLTYLIIFIEPPPQKRTAVTCHHVIRWSHLDCDLEITLPLYIVRLSSVSFTLWLVLRIGDKPTDLEGDAIRDRIDDNSDEATAQQHIGCLREGFPLERCLAESARDVRGIQAHTGLAKGLGVQDAVTGVKKEVTDPARDLGNATGSSSTVLQEDVIPERLLDLVVEGRRYVNPYELFQLTEQGKAEKRACPTLGRPARRVDLTDSSGLVLDEEPRGRSALYRRFFEGWGLGHVLSCLSTNRLS